MFKKLVIFLSLLLCVTCYGHGSSVFLSNDNKRIYKTSVCKLDESFPQMIIIPFFKQASQIVPNCDLYSKHKTVLALFVFYHKWVEYFGDKNFAVRGILEKVMIKWDLEKKVSKKGYNIKGKPFTNHNIVGRVETSSVIWVWKGYNNKISESALIHELVHLAIRASYGDHGDPDHEGPKYRGWSPRHTKMIIESNSMLQSFNL